MIRRMSMGAVAAFAVAVFAQNAEAGTITLTNTTAGLFDASSGNRNVTVTGLEAGFDSGIITDVNIAINFAKADGESFEPPFPGGTPFYNEIHFRLTSPTGSNVTLIGPNSWGAGSGQFDGTIVFDQAGGAVVNFAAAPIAGTFRPTGAGSLDDYNGEGALGVWTLFIQDTVGADALRFRDFTLTLETQPVPEPASMMLLGTGLAFAARQLRRRKR